MRTRAVIIATGARTALGRTALETTFLLRTGVPGIGAAPLADPKGEPVTMGYEPTLDPRSIGEDRAAELFGSALREALLPIGDAGRSLATAAVVSIAGHYAQRSESRAAAVFATRLETRAREVASGVEVEIVPRGGGGAGFALTRLLDALASRKLDLAVFAGAHSDYDPLTVATYAAQRRLYTTSNSDALVPGEAGAAVLLAREDVANRLSLPALARIVAVGTGTESARPDNDVSPFEAKGLTSAVRAAAEELIAEKGRVGWILTDHNFETRRLKEFQAMMTRTHTYWTPPLVLDSPSQRIGHLGSAALPLELAIAAEAYRRGYAPAPVAIAIAGSDEGERGAVLISRP